MPRLLIPDVGDALTLAADWTFVLHNVQQRMVLETCLAKCASGDAACINACGNLLKDGCAKIQGTPTR